MGDLLGPLQPLLPLGELLLLGCELGVLPDQLRLGPVPLLGVADGADEGGAVHPAFREVVLGPLLEQPDAEVLVVEPGQDHDRYVPCSGPHCPDGLGPLAVGEPEVEQDEVGPLGLEHGERGREAAGVQDRERVLRILREELLDQLRIRRVVLDQQDPHSTCPEFGGSVTIENQKSSIDLTISMNSRKRTGFWM